MVLVLPNSGGGGVTVTVGVRLRRNDARHIIEEAA
jgi:hypothetical protein